MRKTTYGFTFFEPFNADISLLLNATNKCLSTLSNITNDIALLIINICSKWNIFTITGFAPIFPDICYHLTHYKPAAADIPVASDNPAHYADAIRYNARTPLQGSLLPLTRLVWA
ncbi:protein FimG-like protein [Escherichia coli]|nr:protein FimG-like protein [Escherichia coli]